MPTTTSSIYGENLPDPNEKPNTPDKIEDEKFIVDPENKDPTAATGLPSVDQAYEMRSQILNPKKTPTPAQEVVEDSVNRDQLNSLVNDLSTAVQKQFLRVMMGQKIKTESISQIIKESNASNEDLLNLLVAFEKPLEQLVTVINNPESDIAKKYSFMKKEQIIEMESVLKSLANDIKEKYDDDTVKEIEDKITGWFTKSDEGETTES